MYTFPRS